MPEPRILVFASSPGALGGIRGLVHLRQILTTLNMLARKLAAK